MGQKLPPTILKMRSQLFNVLCIRSTLLLISIPAAQLTVLWLLNQLKSIY